MKMKADVSINGNYILSGHLYFVCSLHFIRLNTNRYSIITSFRLALKNIKRKNVQHLRIVLYKEFILASTSAGKSARVPGKSSRKPSNESVASSAVSSVIVREHLQNEIITKFKTVTNHATTKHNVVLELIRHVLTNCRTALSKPIKKKLGTGRAILSKLTGV